MDLRARDPTWRSTQAKGQTVLPAPSWRQRIEQGLGLLDVERVEAFGEPAVDRSEKIAGEACYRAISTRDARFDGRIFIAVRTTRIKPDHGI